jgi:hypothetical protein
VSKLTKGLVHLWTIGSQRSDPNVCKAPFDGTLGMCVTEDEASGNDSFAARARFIVLLPCTSEFVMHAEDIKHRRIMVCMTSPRRIKFIIILPSAGTDLLTRTPPR